MYDGGKIIVGLIVFLVLVSLPIWFTRAYGDAGHRADPKLPPNEKECVEPKEFMRAWHMDLLSQWRDAAVRDGDRLYEASDGELHRISLTGNCMKCHTDREKFCSSCHKFAGVEPYCWDCHIQPEGK